MRTSPAPGLGISRSTISKSPPGLEICADFIGVTATLVVAIMPPADRCSGNLGLRRVEKRPGSCRVFAPILCGIAVLGLVRAGFRVETKSLAQTELTTSLPSGQIQQAAR